MTRRQNAVCSECGRTLVRSGPRATLRNQCGWCARGISSDICIQLLINGEIAEITVPWGQFASAGYTRGEATERIRQTLLAGRRQMTELVMELRQAEQEADDAMEFSVVESGNGLNPPAALP